MRLVASNDPILSWAQPAYEGDPAALTETARAMHAVMTNKANPGVGIAAPQVGVATRMFVMNTRSRFWGDARVCINPVVLERRGEMVEAAEGCLTRPGARYAVARHVDITVEYTNLQGERVRQDFTGVNARVFQHETDHLHGVCVWDGGGDGDMAA